MLKLKPGDKFKFTNNLHYEITRIDIHVINERCKTVLCYSRYNKNTDYGIVSCSPAWFYKNIVKAEGRIK